MHSVPAGEVSGLLRRFAELRRKAAAWTGRDFPIIVIQEAGLDGFWIHRAARAGGAAFHEDAWIFFIDANGGLHKNLISESFEQWAAPLSCGIVGRFISATRVGDAASVQLSFKGRSDEWLDFHNLLRINGVWKITNKTATHSCR
jgi:hypothetical protein